jgi:hypothetical protein
MAKITCIFSLCISGIDEGGEGKEDQVEGGREIDDDEEGLPRPQAFRHKESKCRKHARTQGIQKGIAVIQCALRKTWARRKERKGRERPVQQEERVLQWAMPCPLGKARSSSSGPHSPNQAGTHERPTHTLVRTLGHGIGDARHLLLVELGGGRGSHGEGEGGELDRKSVRNSWLPTEEELLAAFPCGVGVREGQA